VGDGAKRRRAFAGAAVDVDAADAAAKAEDEAVLEQHRTQAGARLRIDLSAVWVRMLTVIVFLNSTDVFS
jgi:hypothetical protein